MDFRIFLYCLYCLQIYEEIKSLECELRDKKALLKMDELKKKKRLLRRMGYINNRDELLLKGHVLREITW